MDIFIFLVFFDKKFETNASIKSILNLSLILGPELDISLC